MMNGIIKGLHKETSDQFWFFIYIIGCMRGDRILSAFQTESDFWRKNLNDVFFSKKDSL